MTLNSVFRAAILVSFLVVAARGFSHVGVRAYRVPQPAHLSTARAVEVGHHLVKGRTLAMASGFPISIPISIPIPASVSLTLSRVGGIAKKVFMMLPLPLKLIATILTTLFTLVLVEDVSDWVSATVSKLQGKAPKEEEVKLVQKPFTPTTTSVPIRFLQSDQDPVEYGAEVGAKLSTVAEDAAVTIKYDCRKGQCGTCSVKVGSKWIKTCQSSIPMPLVPGEVYEVIVPKAAVSSSKFFSPRSFLDGVWNNFLGMVGFVGQMRKAEKQYQARLAREKAIADKALIKRQQSS